jgi:type I restriction-modification system DNA methylase subunit
VSNNKELERAELHKTIWRIANDLRGSVDGWDFKTYVLGMLFYRFISENLTSYLNEQERRESPRVLRRLQPLRRWSHEQVDKVLTRSPRARRAHGARAPGRLPFAVGGR